MVQPPVNVDIGHLHATQVAVGAAAGLAVVTVLAAAEVTDVSDSIVAENDAITAFPLATMIARVARFASVLVAVSLATVAHTAVRTAAAVSANNQFFSPRSHCKMLRSASGSKMRSCVSVTHNKSNK